MNKTIKIFTLFLSLSLLTLLLNTLFAQVDLNYQNNQTPTYPEVISMYEKLAEKYDEARLLSYGTTDAGKPLHLFVISKDQDFDPASIHKTNKVILLINNAIHAGEPCGVDASLQMAADLLEARTRQAQYLENTVICIIPAYNIGGVLNRNTHSRVNQNGPEAHGFRGNAKNLDLNRDFIKCDSENAKTFTQIFHLWKPDIFIDTHTTNGADYQYVMTLIASYPDRYPAPLGSFFKEEMLPALYAEMKAGGYEMTPYVYPVKQVPDDGIITFLETPRYSSGYAALFNCLSFITEAHMFKPYHERVMATFTFLNTVLQYADRHHEKIKELRQKAIQENITKKEFVIKWKPDTTTFQMIDFKGYEVIRETSKLTGQERFYYDRALPYQKKIPYYNQYVPEVTVNKPYAYIVPQAWKEVITRLSLNGVKMKKMLKDTTLLVDVYYIADYKTVNTPYEGHYLHRELALRTEKQQLTLNSGDYVIFLNQPANTYIVKTLEPQSPDSFFNWNFFDIILQQKEWFSPYIFEDKAIEILRDDLSLKEAFEKRKKEDSAFAENPFAQLLYIYRHSPYYEPVHMRYPVFRLQQEVGLPLE